MNPFKTYSFTWWQVGIFKIALLAIGILIGSQWPEVWSNNTITLIVIAIIASLYSIYIAFFNIEHKNLAKFNH